MMNVQALYRDYVLRKYKGFESVLKVEQSDIISKVLDGMDCLCIFPTGFGKSLCIFAPPIIKAQQQLSKGSCVIISPLVALASEQTKILESRGQVVLSSHRDKLNEISIASAYGALDDSTVLFVVCSPEEIRKKSFREAVNGINVLSIAIDEGHCITDWGDTFRKDYKFIHELRAFTSAPMTVFTATMTPAMRTTVIQQSGLNADNLFKICLSPDRPEIFLRVEQNKSDMKNLLFIAKELIRDGTKTQKTLIFASSVNQVTNIYLYLRMQLVSLGQVWRNNQLVGSLVEMFHGPTDFETKESIVNDFSSEDSITRVLVSTVAFGMGVNVAKLNRVVVQNLPPAAPILMQMIGRCSRDGSNGECIIFVPIRPTVGSLGFKLRQNCVRKALLGELCEGKKTLTQKEAPTCFLCTCCSFCYSTCLHCI